MAAFIDARLPKRLCRRWRHSPLRSPAASAPWNRCPRNRTLPSLEGLRSRRRPGVEAQSHSGATTGAGALRADHHRSIRTPGCRRLGRTHEPVVLAARAPTGDLQAALGQWWDHRSRVPLSFKEDRADRAFEGCAGESRIMFDRGRAYRATPAPLFDPALRYWWRLRSTFASGEVGRLAAAWRS